MIHSKAFGNIPNLPEKSGTSILLIPGSATVTNKYHLPKYL